MKTLKTIAAIMGLVTTITATAVYAAPVVTEVVDNYVTVEYQIPTRRRQATASVHQVPSGNMIHFATEKAEAPIKDIA